MSSISERILKILEYQNINKSEFAQKLNISNAYVSRLLHNGNIPSDRLIEDISEKFHISETWFRTGEGDMFTELPIEDEFFKAAASISKENDVDAINMVVEYWKLDPKSKKMFWDFIHKLADNHKKPESEDMES